MAQTQAVGRGLTFEQVWAIVQENAQGMKETDRLIKELGERQLKTDEQIEKTAAQMKETDKRIKDATDHWAKVENRFGEIVEFIVMPNLVAKFRELKFEFTKVHERTEINDREHDIFAEVDAFLENGDKVMIVETKTKPTTKHVNEHIERMEKLRQYADLHNDNRKYLGAIAGLVVTENVKTYALKKGFYVIEPSGDTFTITEPKGKDHPHEW